MSDKIILIAGTAIRPLFNAVTTTLGVIAGSITILAFADTFPFVAKDPSKVHVNLAVALNHHDGKPWYIENDAGGEMPYFFNYDHLGTYIGWWENRAWGPGTQGWHVANGAVKNLKVHLSKPGSPHYTVFQAHANAICVAWTSMRWKTGEEFLFLGDIAKTCGEPWYYSGVKAPTVEHHEPPCFWIGSVQHRFGKWKGVHPWGFQINWPAYRAYEWEAQPDWKRTALDREGTMYVRDRFCDENGSVFRANRPRTNREITDWNKGLLRGNLTDRLDLIQRWGDVFREHGVFADGLASKYTDANPRGDFAGRAARRGLPDDDGEPTHVHHDLHIGLDAEDHGNRRPWPRNLDRSPWAEALVVESFPSNSAAGLCNSESSFGPDFVNTQEGLFCDMSEKRLYPVCGSDTAKSLESKDACFDVDNQQLVRSGVVKRTSPYTRVQDWRVRENRQMPVVDLSR
ncbi:hypothetical protein ACHAQH_008205 [Verticillium albo-atrum]